MTFGSIFAINGVLRLFDRWCNVASGARLLVLSQRLARSFNGSIAQSMLFRLIAHGSS